MRDVILPVVTTFLDLQPTTKIINFLESQNKEQSNQETIQPRNNSIIQGLREDC